MLSHVHDLCSLVFTRRALLYFLSKMAPGFSPPQHGFFVIAYSFPCMILLLVFASAKGLFPDLFALLFDVGILTKHDLAMYACITRACATTTSEAMDLTFDEAREEKGRIR